MGHLYQFSLTIGSKAKDKQNMMSGSKESMVNEQGLKRKRRKKTWFQKSWIGSRGRETGP